MGKCEKALGHLRRFIEAEHESEATHKIRQEDILNQVNISTQAKKWRHTWKSRGPYLVDYTEDGAVMLAAGAKGDARLLNCREGGKEICSVNTYETIRAARMCYNENCWALAQKNSICLYDRQGTRIHDFDKTDMTSALDYLPFHFLLVSASGLTNSRPLEWRDLSSGKFVSSRKTQLLSTTPQAIKHNPWNAVIYSGHRNGVVRLWTPNLESEALSFFGCKGGVDTVCPFKRYYVAVSGPNEIVKIFDIRNAAQPVNHYRLKSAGPVSIDASYTGLLAISQGPQVNIWKNPEIALSRNDLNAGEADLSRKDQFYMRHRYTGSGLRFENVRFRPFEDILGCGLNMGVETLIVPGSGSSNIDALENNPYATSREKAKALVRRLLDKLPADTIVLDPTQLLAVK